MSASNNCTKSLKERILDIDPEKIDFSNTEIVKVLFLKLLNAYANLLNEHEKLKEDYQKLKDEINRLKGEKGKPDIKPNKDNDNEEDEEESEKKTSKKKKKRNRTSKKPDIKIDREEFIDFSEEEKADLPSDAEFKGYREVTIQNIKLVADNVLIKIPRWYSPSEGKTYEPELPKKYQLGEYGADLHAFILMLYFLGRVPEDKIETIVNEIGVLISDTKVGNIIRGNEENFSEEKMNILNAGLQTTMYQQTDDTGIRVNGMNCYLNVYCNPYYTVFIINKNKKRKTLKIFMKRLGHKIIILVADDARQFKDLTELLMLCWVHEGRHYKKLNPVLSFHKKVLKKFLDKFWTYYNKLKTYKKKPTKVLKKKLDKEFDELFSTVTGYEKLDHRIQLTKAKKESLLVVLDYPEVPLHNNASEQEIREPVIKRKVSNGLRSEKGKLAWENHFTIMRTCRKQGVSYWQYMKNNFAGIKQESLTEKILVHATT